MGRLTEAQVDQAELEKLAEDMAYWGATAEAIAEAKAAFRGDVIPDSFDVLAENATAVRLFLALATQWRVTAISTMAQARLIRLGLDYAAIEPTARMAQLELRDEDFARLRTLEAFALIAWAEEARQA